MFGATHRSLLRLGLVLALALPMTGCEWRLVRMQLPTFFSAGIEELHFWRQNGGDFERSGHMRLSSLIGPAGSQVVRYTMVLPDGTETFTLTTPVVAVSGDSIIVELYFARADDPGAFRVSARNNSGESDLSEEEIPL